MNEKNLKAGPLEGYVTYDDPVTGDLCYRPRTPEDGILPGDKRVSDGVSRSSNLATWHDWFVGGDSIGSILKSLEGKHVRITVEVLENPFDLPNPETKNCL